MCQIRKRKHLFMAVGAEELIRSSKGKKKKKGLYGSTSHDGGKAWENW